MNRTDILFLVGGIVYALGATAVLSYRIGRDRAEFRSATDRQQQKEDSYKDGYEAGYRDADIDHLEWLDGLMATDDRRSGPVKASLENRNRDHLAEWPKLLDV